MNFNQLRNKLFIASVSLGLASTVGVFIGNDKLKTLSFSGIGAGIASVITLEIIAGITTKENENIKKLSLENIKHKDKVIRDNEKTIVNLESTIKSKLQDIEKQYQDLSNLESIIQTQESLINTKNSELIEASTALGDLKGKLQNIGEFNASESHRIVRKTYDRQVKKVRCVIDAMIRNHSDYQEYFQSILDEFESYKIKFLKKIAEYEAIDTFDDLLDVGLELQEMIIDKSFELRSKAQQMLIKNFGDILDDSVPVDELEEIINSLTGQAKEKIELVEANLEADKRAIASEWVVSNEQIVNSYKTNYTDVLNNAKEAVNRIDALEKELAELRKPLQLFGDSTYARAANSISGWYYSKYQYLLDAINWDEIETGFKILFSIRRNPGLTEKELYTDNSREQLAAFTNALHGTLPEFEFNRQNSTVTLTVQLRRVTKTSIEKLETDICKIWVPASKFESYVKKFERVRITAGSTGGKSPTAKNLALAIMKTRSGNGEIKLFDPQHGSKKDFWNMPKAGTSHADNLTGLKEVCDLIESRKNSDSHRFKLYIFDEIDNTVSKLGKQSSEFRELLKVASKEGSHSDIGVIFIGQSADANEIPGMTHSNWNNLVQLHIGSNAGIAIDKITTITTEDKTRLLEQYRKIQEYCDRKNNDLGLDIYTDPSAYRFALVVPLTGLPKFIQLPDFDSYDYADVMQKQSENKSKPEVENPTVYTSDENSVPKCPHCYSVNLKGNGNGRKKCKDCNKTFADSKVIY